MAHTDAATAGAHFDDTMKRCILRLYRSAVTVAEPTWGERLAQRTGARLVVFPGCSHWWPLQRPDDVAAEIRAHVT